FEPVLIEGKAIQLHPLVCTAFNADFDGDQMAVHVPLSIESQVEARVLMMSTNNILRPADGKPIIVPSQDIVLGLYYLSMAFDGLKGEGMSFGNIAEIEMALFNKEVTLHSKIKARYNTVDESGNPKTIRVETTPGRMMISQVLPRHPKVPFDVINRVLTKKDVSNLIDVVYRHCGQKETVIFCDRMMGLGFANACKAGLSFGKDDLIIPEEKTELVAHANARVKEFEQQYQDGLITKGEKYNKVVDIWSACTDDVTKEMMNVISKPASLGYMNSVYMMAHSGARGSTMQIRQLAGMRGLMAKPSGEIIEAPIISNFKEGLTVLEYFNSTHGARKGLADTALKTANSGYLTRRLVDVAQDAIITEDDCGTDTGFTVRPVIEGGDVIVSLAERILGRTTAKDVLDPISGAIIVKAGTIIDEAMSEAIETAGIDSVEVRSVLTCKAKNNGICSKCYGRDLARGTAVNIGEAVGVMAAQSIGEPGTQLTMRTFHIGGAAQRGAAQSAAEAAFDATIEIRNKNVVVNSEGVSIVMGRNTEVALLDKQGREKATHRLAYGSKLLVNDGDKVKRGAKLAEWDPYTIPIITEKDGIVFYGDLVEGMSIREELDEATGISSKVVTDWRQQPKGTSLKPRIMLTDDKGKVMKLSNGLEANYYMPVGALLNVENSAQVKAGDIIARIPHETSKTRDITGGLPRVAELFEARRPKDFAIISEIDGQVEFGKDYKSKRRIIVKPTDGKGEPKEYLIPKGKHVAVNEGDYVRKGDQLLDGSMVPHDILSVMGVEALADYLNNEIQDVYRLQGVKINDKHIEVIIRQMLQKVEITDAGDTTFVNGEVTDREELAEINAKTIEANKRPAKGVLLLQGITKASLQTRSFISAASFQETTRVLTEAAINGKVDKLIGLKENVIVGRLIPAGTGAFVHRLKRFAAERDAAALEANMAKNPPVVDGENVVAAIEAPKAGNDASDRKEKHGRVGTAG
ncbi:MAG: DNA-directed RNA polymerase subunit beta', partial [Alphaproteobacteria bacterium]|nr:DNA-directed RNA polymerase subunit beta' [Alphaproteobacteria bacterium]